MARWQQRMTGQQTGSQSTDSLHTLNYGGLSRSYLLFIPSSYDGTKKAPLLIMLHGGGGNAKSSLNIASDLTDYADEKGVILVVPNGTGPMGNRLLTWNSGNCCGMAVDKQVDDVGFIRALVGTLKSQYRIDERRIFATGFSNGAMLSQRLACEMSDILSGIGPVSGSLKDNCSPTHPLSVIMFNGTEDQHVLYQGGRGPMQADRQHPRSDHSVAYAVDFWAMHDHCPTKPQHSQQGHIVEEAYESCSGGTAVVLYMIESGGHAWPGGRSYMTGIQPTQEISASRKIVDFMLAHPKPIGLEK